MNDDVAKARQGDRDALNRLLQAYETRLQAMAENRLGDELRKYVRTSDVLQSAYLDVVRDVGNFLGSNPEEFLVWFGQILENTIRDRRRFHHAEKRRGPISDPSDPGSLLRRVGVKCAGPLSNMVFDEEFLIFSEALDRLMPEQRDVIVRRKIREESFAAIAADFAKSEEAVRKLLSRALATLVLEIEKLRKGRGTGSKN
jgi:RNA polymerase sigma factor (sigma-70 family)